MSDTTQCNPENPRRLYHWLLGIEKHAPEQTSVAPHALTGLPNRLSCRSSSSAT
jgi:hypothetical protein